jgi:hypothetical protein
MLRIKRFLEYITEAADVAGMDTAANKTDPIVELRDKIKHTQQDITDYNTKKGTLSNIVKTKDGKELDDAILQELQKIYRDPDEKVKWEKIKKEWKLGEIEYPNDLFRMQVQISSFEKKIKEINDSLTDIQKSKSESESKKNQSTSNDEKNRHQEIIDKYEEQIKKKQVDIKRTIDRLSKSKKQVTDKLTQLKKELSENIKMLGEKEKEEKAKP